MKSRTYQILYLLIFAQLGCKQEKDTSEYINRAIEIFINSNNTDTIKLDTSIMLLNKALQVNNKDEYALELKSAILFKLRKGKELIDVADNLIQINPKNPRYISKKALYLDLTGRKMKADSLYQDAIHIYQELIEKEENNFNLKLEYLGTLEAMNDTIATSHYLSELKTQNWNSTQNQILNEYNKSTISISRMYEFWEGKLEYDEMEETKYETKIPHNHK